MLVDRTLRPWTERRSIVAFVLAFAFGPLGCSSDSTSSAEGTVSCASDLDCKFNETCETATGACTQGAAAPWTLHGSATCKLDTLGDNGVAAVIAQDDIGPIEITDHTVCAVVPTSGDVSLVVSGSQNAHVSLTIPITAVQAGGRSPVVPFITEKYQSEGTMVEMLQGELGQGYAVSGYVDIQAGDLNAGATVKVALNAAWQVVVTPWPKCDAPCTSQIDCGPSDGIGETLALCSRDEITDSPACVVYCPSGPQGDETCTKSGGTCDINGRCRRPCP